MVIVDSMEMVVAGMEAGGGGGGAEPAAVAVTVSVDGVGIRVMVEGTAVMMPGFWPTWFAQMPVK
jgi:hypothetical protein